MQKNKILTAASTLALALGVASAQTDTTTPAPVVAPAASAQVTTFTDVPAGHWAKDAVDLIVQKGLIQGFPDGTFRGNENLTRYQAALIFYRLLQSGTLSSGSVSTTDMTTIANGMQEVSTELASVSSRVTDLEKLSADQETRIAALEAQISTLTASTSGADTTALTARIDALETAVKNIPAGTAGPAGAPGPVGPAGAAADTTDINTRLTALEARVNAQPASTTTTTTTNNTTNPSTIVIGDTGSTATTTASTAGRLYVGANYDYSLGGNQKRGSYGAVVGTTQAIGPVGAQVSVDYEPTNGTINADATATYHLNQGAGLSPYVGVGFGLTSSKARDLSTGGNVNAAAPGNKTVTDYSVGGLVGIDYRFTDSIGVYAEVQGRYYITNNGIGTNLSTAKPGFGSTVKAGLKFFF